VTPRILAAVGSGVPALIIIFGALWSTYRVIKKSSPTISTRNVRIVKSPLRLAASNILVAAGTIVLSASGSLAGRLGKDRAFAVTLLIGLCILFAGFLVATNTSQTTLPVSTGDKLRLSTNHKRSDARRKNRKQ
jgi:hypothetical protein